MLDKNDERTIEKIVVKAMGEVLEGVVLPQMQEIRDDLSVVKTDVKVLKTEVADLKDRVGSLELTTNRIERKLDVEIVRHDSLSVKVSQHDKRLAKLEAGNL